MLSIFWCWSTTLFVSNFRGGDLSACKRIVISNYVMSTTDAKSSLSHKQPPRILMHYNVAYIACNTLSHFTAGLSCNKSYYFVCQNKAILVTLAFHHTYVSGAVFGVCSPVVIFYHPVCDDDPRKQQHVRINKYIATLFSKRLLWRKLSWSVS